MPDTIIRSMSGEVIQVDVDTRYIVIADPKKGVHGTFYVNGKTKLSADKKTALVGKKKLALEDFQPGQTVKVTYRLEDMGAVEVRARRPKS